MKGTSLKAMRSSLAPSWLFSFLVFRFSGKQTTRQPNHQTTRSGQSLVEAIVAVGITLLVITGLVVLAVGAVRSVRDRSFSELPSSGTSRVVWTGSEWGVLAGTETIGTYTRSFTPEQISAGETQSLLPVGWAESGG